MSIISTKKKGKQKMNLKKITKNLGDYAKKGLSPLKGKRMPIKQRRRIGKALVGDNNAMWKGEKAGIRSGRSRARKYYPLPKHCQLCSQKATERHHKDNNTLNNKKDNIMFLCRHCHMAIDGRLKNFIKKFVSVIGNNEESLQREEEHERSTRETENDLFHRG